MSKSVLHDGIHLKTCLPPEDVKEIGRITGELAACRGLLRELVERLPFDYDYMAAEYTCQYCRSHFKYEEEKHNEHCCFQKAKEVLDDESHENT